MTIQSTFLDFVSLTILPSYFTTTSFVGCLPSWGSTITSVFPAAVDIFYLSHQFFSVTKPWLIYLQELAIEVSLVHVQASSANSKWLLMMFSIESLVYKLHSTGLMTEPCEMPTAEQNIGDLKLLT